jgi:hypothetical protein
MCNRCFLGAGFTARDFCARGFGLAYEALTAPTRIRQTIAKTDRRAGFRSIFPECRLASGDNPSMNFAEPRASLRKCDICVQQEINAVWFDAAMG